MQRFTIERLPIGPLKPPLLAGAEMAQEIIRDLPRMAPGLVVGVAGIEFFRRYVSTNSAPIPPLHGIMRLVIGLKCMTMLMGAYAFELKIREKLTDPNSIKMIWWVARCINLGSASIAIYLLGGLFKENFGGSEYPTKNSL